MESAIISQDKIYVPKLNLTNKNITLHEDTWLCHLEPVVGEKVKRFNENCNFVSNKYRVELDKIDINPEYFTEDQKILVKNLIEEYAIL